MVAANRLIPLSLAACTIAKAIGCELSCSILAARANTSSSTILLKVTIFARVGSPVVIVPVLSKAKIFIIARRSNCKPPLIKTPIFALRATPDKTAAGVPIASAQGEAATKTIIAL